MKKQIKIIVVLTLSFIIGISFVKAKNNSNDLFQFKDELSIKKDLNGTAFLGGKKVVLNNNIDGIGVIIGETLNLKGKMEYLLTGTITLNQDETNEIEKDAFILSEEAKLNGTINRDAYIFANYGKLNGTFKRNVYIAGTDINLNGEFNGNVTINAVNIKIGKDVKIKGTLKYNKDASIAGITDNIKTQTYENKMNKVSIAQYMYNFMMSYIKLVLVGIIIMYVWGNVFKKSCEIAKQNKAIASNIGKGFIILLGLPILSIVAITTGLLSSVGVLLIIIYGLSVYLSEIFAAYILAVKLNNKYLKKDWSNYTLLILGLLLLRVLSIIPIIGTFISIASILFGIGVISNLIISSKSSSE